MTPPATKIQYFRLKAGQHHEPDWSAPEPAPGRKRPSVLYKPGDVVPAATDLVRRFGPDRFEEVPAAAASAAQNPTPAPSGQDRASRIGQYGDLSVMTMPELKQVAKSEEIDLTGCKTKADALQRIEEWATAVE